MDVAHGRAPPTGDPAGTEAAFRDGLAAGPSLNSEPLNPLRLALALHAKGEAAETRG